MLLLDDFLRGEELDTNLAVSIVPLELRLRHVLAINQENSAIRALLTIAR